VFHEESPPGWYSNVEAVESVLEQLVKLVLQSSKASSNTPITLKQAHFGVTADNGDLPVGRFIRCNRPYRLLMRFSLLGPLRPRQRREQARVGFD
jgi:hypothetical protein